MRTARKGNSASEKAKANKSRVRRAPRQRKSRLSPATLEDFRFLLLAKRRELVDDVSTLRNAALQNGSPGDGSGSSAMPVHLADKGSDAWEQAVSLGMFETKEKMLREIDAALQRIRDKTYGICEATGKVIPKARLRAIPWANYCIEYAAKREAGLLCYGSLALLLRSAISSWPV